MQSMPSSFNDPRWLMRWVTLVTLLITILTALGASIILAFQTRSAVFLAIPGPLSFALLRPVIRYLFPSRGK